MMHKVVDHIIAYVASDSSGHHTRENTAWKYCTEKWHKGINEQQNSWDYRKNQSIAILGEGMMDAMEEEV